MKITDMNLDKAIRKIAFPAIFSFLFTVLYEIVDAFWLGRLSYSSVFAAMGAASFITWSLYSLINIASAGVNSLVARKVGEDDKEGYQRVAAEGYSVASIIGLLITFIMTLVYRKIFVVIGLEGQVLEDACKYFSVMNAGFLIIYFYNINTMVFNAHGDTKTGMKIQAFMLLFNCVIDPLFILGWGPFPKLGIKGAAIATIFSQTLGFTVGLVLLSRRKYIAKRAFKRFFKYIYAKKIVKIGFPVALVNWVFAMVYPALTSLITKTGNIDALGALNICHKLEGIPYFISMGFSVTAAALAGQYIGAGKSDMSIKAVHRTVLYNSAFLFVISVVFYFIPEKILSLITSDPKIIFEGARYLKIIAIFELFLGFEVVYEGGFTGISKTHIPMFVSIPLTLLRIPLAYYLCFTLNMSIPGIWWAISNTTFLKGLIIYIMFKHEQNTIGVRS